jgi:hypothetical protein
MDADGACANRQKVLIGSRHGSGEPGQASSGPSTAPTWRSCFLRMLGTADESNLLRYPAGTGARPPTDYAAC